MKLKIITALAILMLLFTACHPSDESAPPPVNEEPEAPEEAESAKTSIYTELGIPLATKYPNGNAARCAWDMAIYEGEIFMGSGDYNENRGPAEIWRYDIANGTFAQSAILPDEEINEFCLIYGNLAAPGIDPKEEWDLGNYYVYENGEWVTYRVLPGGIHCFDIIEYEGMIFAGLGVLAGESPIAFSWDAGESFKQLPLYKDDVPLDTTGREYIRVYDFFIFNDELYAFLYFSDEPKLIEIYRYDYDKDAFFFEADWKDLFARRPYKYDFIGEKLVFNEKVYFTTGYLYESTDMATITRIDFPNKAVICDIYVANDTLYALATHKDQESDKFQTTVYTLKEGETEFTELFSFLYDVPSMSMVVEGDNFYIGMGNGKASHEKNGMLLHIKLPIESE